MPQRKLVFPSQLGVSAGLLAVFSPTERHEIFTEVELTDIKAWKKFFARAFEQGIYRALSA
jgi:hypothetical protein